MINNFFTILAVLSLALFLGCDSESRNNSRAFVEGKITGTQIDYKEINISLSSDSKNIADTFPNSSGDFILSGPLLSDTFSLVSNKKIKSFSASKSGCKLSTHALQILVPAGTTYLVFNEIILE